MKTVTLTIPSIHCNHCVHTIQTEVTDLDGIKSVVANAVTKDVKIDFEDPASEEGIRELLKQINYPASE